jgi:deoxyribodipyrimidine photolyase
VAGESELPPLDPVIYWVRKVLRGHENPALDVAICAANRLRRPLLVLIEVEDRYPCATARRQHFVLEAVVPITLR